MCGGHRIPPVSVSVLSEPGGGAAAPVRRCPTLRRRSHPSSGPFPPSKISHSANQNPFGANWEAPRHRCLFAGSCDPACCCTPPNLAGWPNEATIDQNQRFLTCNSAGRVDQGRHDGFVARSEDKTVAYRLIRIKAEVRIAVRMASRLGKQGDENHDHDDDAPDG
jgi:hypothetical protein